MEEKIFVRHTEEEVLRELKEMPGAYRTYQGWTEDLRERFMAFCTGKKTLPVLYDTVFKTLMNPDTHPERLEDCISCLLKQRVTIQTVLPMEDILMDGVSTMVMDILVRLDDDALVLVEIQKIPYYFPAERASCYSADLLLRQYSRVKAEKGKAFSYKDLQKVYTIIFYEQSIEVFKEYSEICTHHAKMTCDSGLKLNFLQEFYLVALDVFRKSEYAKCRDPKERLVGWLSFFCTEDADEAEELCKTYPWLWELYAEMAEFGRKPEELISMFSEFLREMDRNTIRYMVDDMKEQIEKGKQELAEINKTLAEKNEALAKKDEALAKKDEALAKKNEALAKKDEALAEKNEALAEKNEALAEKDEALKAQTEEIARLKAMLATTTQN